MHNLFPPSNLLRRDFGREDEIYQSAGFSVVGFPECEDNSKMKNYYGYSGKPPVLAPNKNMNLKLHGMMAEVQWYSEQKKAASKETIKKMMSRQTSKMRGE